MTSSRSLILAGLTAVSALALAGCASSTTGAGETDDDAFQVVTSTSVYGAIVEAIGGDLVENTSIIDSAAQDPHEYEASASDQLTVSNADLIVENGGGYDAFVDALIEAGGSEAHVVTAVEYSHDYPGEDAAEDAEAEEEHDHADGEAEDEHVHIEGFNEHVWYDPHTIEHVAEAIAEELSEALPDDAETFEANLAAFTAEIEGLETILAEIETAHAGESVFVTEPVPVYLTAAAGLENVTPEAFAEAVEEGQDVAPATLLESLELLRSGDVSVVIVNAQTGGAETTQVIEEAETQGIPVVEFTETLPDGQTYISWMQSNIDVLSAALGE